MKKKKVNWSDNAGGIVTPDGGVYAVKTSHGPRGLHIEQMTAIFPAPASPLDAERNRERGVSGEGKKKRV